MAIPTIKLKNFNFEEPKSTPDFQKTPVQLTDTLGTSTLQTTTPQATRAVGPLGGALNLGIGFSKALLDPKQTAVDVHEASNLIIPSLVSGVERAGARVTETGGRAISSLAETLNLPGQIAEAVTQGRVKAPELKPVVFNQVSSVLERKADEASDLSKFLQSQEVQVQDDRLFAEKLKDPKFLVQGLTNSFLTFAGAMGVSVAGTIIGGPVAGVGAGLAFAGALEGGLAINDVIDFIESSDKPEIQALKGDKDFQNNVGLAVGITNGMLEMLPIAKLLNRSAVGGSIKRKILREITGNIITQMASEGGTEGLQEIVSNAVAKIYDEDRELLQGVAESTLFGGLTGGGASVTTDVTQAGIRRVRETTPAERQRGSIKLPFGEESDNLAQEAKKFKTAEEFVEAQPVVYHGSSVPLKSFSNKKGGVFFTDNYADATGFAGTPDNVYEGFLNFKKPLVIDAKGAKWDNLNTKWGKSTVEVASNAEKAGHDGVTFKNIVDNIGDTEGFGGESTIHFAFKPKDSFINESQLTDIFNKAKVVEPVVREAKEAPQQRGQSLSQQEVLVDSSLARNIPQKQTKSQVRAETKQTVKQVQESLISQIEASGLDKTEKSQFIKTIKNTQTEKQLESMKPKVEERIAKTKVKSFTKGLRSQINQELKTIKPVKKGQKRVAKYDYETNKFLQELKDINGYTQEKATKELETIPTEELSQAQLIKNRLLSYVANGAKSSQALIANVLGDIQTLKDIGKEAKDETDFQAKLERQQKQEEALEAIKIQKPSKFGLKQLKSIYISSVANLYSTLNAVAGKEIADKYDYGLHQTNSKDNFGFKVEDWTKKAEELYNVKNRRELNGIFVNELAQKDYQITDTGGLTQDIGKFEIMNIYNSTKNDIQKERYNNAFGEEQVNSLIANLTPEDLQLADYLMEEVQQYRDIFNQRSIEITGRDMGTVENYWPSSAEFTPDVYDDIRIQGETPSAIKERSKSSRVIPKMANAWLVAQKHSAQGEHVKEVSLRYEELKRVFSDRSIRITIKNKYGDHAYESLQNHIETFSLNYRTQGIDVVSTIYNNALNNWVKAKIFSPTVFTRQLISAPYSIAQVGVKNYSKYTTEVIQNPKKAFDFMWKEVPFMKARFRRGYSEALEEAIRGTKNINISKGAITQLATIPTRTGDITAIMLNGYPVVKTALAKGKSMEQAISEFQKFTEKTQQSGSPANLSDLQRQKGFGTRLLLRFKNTLNQLLRLQVDATTQYVNKQITAKELATQTILYSIYTPVMYTLIGYVITQGFKGLLFEDDDEDKSLVGDIMQNFFLQPFQAIPVLDAVTEATYSKIREKAGGKKAYYGVFSYPLFDDIETAVSKLGKKEPTLADYLRAVSLVQEPITGLPTETLLRYFNYVTGKKKTSGIFSVKIPSISVPSVSIPTIKIPSISF